VKKIAELLSASLERYLGKGKFSERRVKMNLTSKKFISLFLIFSLVMLSGNLLAKERRGAKLIVTKNDGQLIEGELITVKPNSLLLLDTEGKDVSIDISEIKVIKIVKKSKLLVGAGLGLLIGAGIGAIHGLTTNDPWYNSTSLGNAAWGALLGIPSAIIGGIWGVGAGTDKTIQIEGLPQASIEFILKELRKKARIRNYK
jgi:hypothetical protein